MGYRLAKQMPLQSNDQGCLILRQQYAKQFRPLLESGKRIINVDESWLNTTRHLRKVWIQRDARSTFKEKQVQPRISLLLAIDTEGRMWCALTQANIDMNIEGNNIHQITSNIEK